MDRNNMNYADLLALLRESERPYEMELIERAYNLADSAHSGIPRLSGMPYITHPVSVACILVELGMDTESIVAALLHDVVEDTDITLEEIRKIFGMEIARLIDGVTKLGKIPFSTREEEQAENVRKMLIAMADDIRVIIIKLADRLHNMRTIEFMPDQKRRDKARENMEVYAPIAHRLGIRTVKEELEDISIRYLDPVAYKEIEESLDMRKSEREGFINTIKERIRERLVQTIPNAYLEGRVKSINGIYRKVYVQGRSFDEIYDIYAVRVLVDTDIDCYNVLGIIHDMFTPIPSRFKDYISTPKPNGYQSLHTTVLGKEGIPFEVQIRTWEMHHTAEYGIAAHWKYKIGYKQKDTSLEDSLIWIRQILENQQDAEDAVDIVRNIKTDLAPEEVFVCTPKGDVITLPQGSTTIDFAYAIHSGVGNRMVGAKVSGKIVPIHYVLKTGEIVEVITTKDPTHGPSRDWLKIVRTSSARSKIRNWFKKERREENIVEGRSELEREFKRAGIRLPESQMKEFLVGIARRAHCNTTEDLFAAIGYGGVSLQNILGRIKEEFAKLAVAHEPEEGLRTGERLSPATEKKDQGGIIIDGLDNCLIKFSRCCNPLPGDDVIGFITRGYGVSIHKKSCTNVPEDIYLSAEPERWVRVRWAGKIDEEFKSTLEIHASDRRGLLADITQQLAAMHISIHTLNSREDRNGNAIILATITVRGLEHLEMVMSRMRSIDGITQVNRY